MLLRISRSCAYRHVWVIVILGLFCSKQNNQFWIINTWLDIRSQPWMAEQTDSPTNIVNTATSCKTTKNCQSAISFKRHISPVGALYLHTHSDVFEIWELVYIQNVSFSILLRLRIVLYKTIRSLSSIYCFFRLIEYVLVFSMAYLIAS